jgi:digeranylgeranylglycerophospholipid reductase
MAEDFDCIVVGAGPAGSMAAQTMAQAGIKVLLLEKHPRIGVPLQCGEGISYSGLARFVEPQPEWISAHIHKALLVSPSNQRVLVNHPRAGFVLDRKIFDRRLAEAAASQGATVTTNSCAVGLLSANGRGFGGVRVLQDGRERDYHARVIVAADGVESLVARWAGIDSSLGLEQVDSAAQYLLSQVEVEPDLMEFHLGRDVAPGGYAWVFPKGPNSANVGLAIAPHRSVKRAKELLDRFVSERFGRYRVMEFMMGAVPCYDRKRDLVKENVLLVGDAGRVVDSLSGAGISNALLSGKLAGKTVSRFVKDGQSSFSGLKKYEDELLKEKGSELRFYSFCRAIYLKMTDEDFDVVVRFLGDYLGDETIHSIQPIALIKTIIKSNRRLFPLLRHLVW